MDKKIGQQKFAVLIDGDNAQASLLVEILAEVSKFGLITIKRIYGDWTKANMNKWKTVLHTNAIQPIQQFMYTVGKNSTDSAMIIDAMDLLHSNFVDGFCIVSSDSDYTRLATRIREEGYFVIGVGERKTPEAFTNACNQFIYSENLVKAKSEEKKDKPDKTKLKVLLSKAFEMVAKEDDWVNLAEMGSVLRRLDPAFDPRTYGHTRLHSLIKGFSETFVLKRDNKLTPPAVYVALTAQQDGPSDSEDGKKQASKKRRTGTTKRRSRKTEGQGSGDRAKKADNR